jgi:hypothetical protein
MRGWQSGLANVDFAFATVLKTPVLNNGKAAVPNGFDKSNPNLNLFWRKNEPVIRMKSFPKRKTALCFKAPRVYNVA